MTTYLTEHLGRRIPTKELAEWLQLDVDSLRRHYASFGGIRPVPNGKILFFERNVVDALRGAYHAVKGGEDGAVEGAGPAEWTDKAEIIRHENRSAGVGGSGKGRLEPDRHGLLGAAMGGKVLGS